MHSSKERQERAIRNKIRDLISQRNNLRLRVINNSTYNIDGLITHRELVEEMRLKTSQISQLKTLKLIGYQGDIDAVLHGV
jgi:hypothetical protein